MPILSVSDEELYVLRLELLSLHNLVPATAFSAYDMQRCVMFAAVAKNSRNFSALQHRIMALHHAFGSTPLIGGD